MSDALTESARLEVPEGSPKWISEKLLRDTIATWQPYYDGPLTIADAVEILRNVGSLLDHLPEYEP